LKYETHPLGAAWQRGLQSDRGELKYLQPVRVDLRHVPLQSDRGELKCVYTLVDLGATYRFNRTGGN